MNNYLIKTENISKRYPIKKQSDKPDTLVGTILDFAYKPMKNLKDLKKKLQKENNLTLIKFLKKVVKKTINLQK